MPQIKFFFASGACSLAPHILLHEIGVDFVPIQVQSKGPQVNFSDEFHRINPKMRVPVIVVDDEVITEQPAVATIIASLAPNLYLMGKSPIETARVYEWMNYLSGSLHAGGFGHFWRPDRWSSVSDPASLDGIKTKALDTISECFNYIEGKLEGVHAVGDAFTAVDPFLYVFYRWGTFIGLDMPSFSKYSALVRNLEGIGAVQAALKSEHLNPIF